jgi:DNA repair protein RadC
MIEQEQGYRSRFLIVSPDNVFEVCKDMRSFDREHFFVLHLDAQRKLIARELAAIGTLSNTMLTIREVFKGAILNNSQAIILVHNHPSGDPNPSPEDRSLTSRLAEAGEFLGIPVLDHVVIGSDSYRTIPILVAMSSANELISTP